MPSRSREVSVDPEGTARWFGPDRTHPTRCYNRRRMANLEAIIAAAASVFRTKGYHAATVQDIADEVGILKGSLYHHVKSKEDLLYLMVKEPIAQIYERSAEH